MNTNGCHPPSPATLAACGKQIHVGQVPSAQQERKSTGMGGQGGLGHKERSGLPAGSSETWLPDPCTGPKRLPPGQQFYARLLC